MSAPPASLIIAASEHDSNLYYACRFLAPDAFVFLPVDGRRVANAGEGRRSAALHGAHVPVATT